MARHSDWPSTLTPAAVHILLALADSDRHGLGIVDEVERRSRGTVTLGPGTLYGTLKKLRDVRFIVPSHGVEEEAERDTRRRYYRIAPAGREALARELGRLERQVHTGRLKSVLEPVEE